MPTVTRLINTLSMVEAKDQGKFNIGVTAGIETTICDPSWIDGLNRMNLNLVSSNFTKKVFLVAVQFVHLLGGRG